jgi:hypothetical protein
MSGHTGQSLEGGYSEYFSKRAFMHLLVNIFVSADMKGIKLITKW